MNQIKYLIDFNWCSKQYLVDGGAYCSWPFDVKRWRVCGGCFKLEVTMVVYFVTYNKHGGILV